MAPTTPFTRKQALQPCNAKIKSVNKAACRGMRGGEREKRECALHIDKKTTS